MEGWLNVIDSMRDRLEGYAWRNVVMTGSFDTQVRQICRAGACVDLSEARGSRWADTVELLNRRPPGYLTPLLVFAEGG